MAARDPAVDALSIPSESSTGSAGNSSEEAGLPLERWREGEGLGASPRPPLAISGRVLLGRDHEGRGSSSPSRAGAAVGVVQAAAVVSADLHADRSAATPGDRSGTEKPATVASSSSSSSSSSEVVNGDSGVRVVDNPLASDRSDDHSPAPRARHGEVTRP
jgi:hypothetical protein